MLGEMLLGGGGGGKLSFHPGGSTDAPRRFMLKKLELSRVLMSLMAQFNPVDWILKFTFFILCPDVSISSLKRKKG